MTDPEEKQVTPPESSYYQNIDEWFFGTLDPKKTPIKVVNDEKETNTETEKDLKNV